MRIFVATMVGVTAANAGYLFGLVGAVLVSPIVGHLPALTTACVVSVLATVTSFAVVVRAMSPK